MNTKEVHVSVHIIPKEATMAVVNGVLTGGMVASAYLGADKIIPVAFLPLIGLVNGGIFGAGVNMVLHSSEKTKSKS